MGSGTRGQQPRAGQGSGHSGTGRAGLDAWESRLLLHTRVLQGSQPGVAPAQPPPWGQSKGISSPAWSSHEEEEWNKVSRRRGWSCTPGDPTALSRELNSSQPCGRSALGGRAGIWAGKVGWRNILSLSREAHPCLEPAKSPLAALMGSCPLQPGWERCSALGQGQRDPNPSPAVVPPLPGTSPARQGTRDGGTDPLQTHPRFQNLLLFTFQVKSHANSCLFFWFFFLSWFFLKKSVISKKDALLEFSNSN